MAASRNQAESQRRPRPAERAIVHTDTRVKWVDQARGVAILLVVFGHTWINTHSDHVMTQVVFSTIFHEIYLFHMPVFFFLSGMFLSGSLCKMDAKRFLSSRARTLIRPVLIWATVLQILRTLLGQPTSVQDFLVAAFRPDDLFWFVWALLLCQLIGVFLFRIGGRRIVGIAALICTVATIIFLPLDFKAYPFRTALGLSFYLLGGFIGPIETKRPEFGAAAFLAAQIAAATFSASRACYVIAAFVATLGFLWTMAALPPKHRAYPPLAWLGRNSFPIYLIHGALIGAHVLLIKIGMTSPWGVVGIPFIGAVATSVVGIVVLDHVGLGALIGRGSGPKSLFPASQPQ